MNLTLNYFTTTTIHLSLEDFHNAGLTPEQTKAIIDKKVRPFSYHTCYPQGLNQNWSIEVSSTDDATVESIVTIIKWALCEELSKLKKK